MEEFCLGVGILPTEEFSQPTLKILNTEKAIQNQINMDDKARAEVRRSTQSFASRVQSLSKVRSWF